MKVTDKLNLRSVVLTLSIIITALYATAADKRPNILLILTDDLGFSDIGCYGSEIETPVLDRLAANGLRFSQFYNTAKCHSSRVCLLSGRWCMQAGDVKLNRAVTIPEIIAPTGYFTAMTGKWHLTGQPHDFGFQRFFGHLSGACNYYRGDRTFHLNGKPWQVPKQGFYTTVANVDYALKFLRENRPAGNPWFLYIAFNAPHAPLQPLQSDYDKYLGRYDCGWDEIQAARLARQRKLKLLPPTAEPWSRPQNIPAWQELTPQLRNWESRRMAAYAALIERIDTEVGRVVAELESTGELENTLIMFFSDNGACPYDRPSTYPEGNPCSAEVLWSDSTGWAWARNTPFRYYKQNQFEGGITTPAIMHWPAGLRQPPGFICRTPAHLVDVLPTVAELAETPLPAQYPGRELSALAGVSLAPILRGGELPKRPPIHLMFNQDRGLRDGNWKIVSFQSKAWELYNIAEDRTESVNLADKYPERVTSMAAQWHKIAQTELRAPKHLIRPVVTDDTTPHLHREWSVYSGNDGMRTSIRKMRKRKKR
jgi:arylsulfatase A-like enzyme